MKRLNSETELIWKDNKDAFVKAGKDFKADQDISILKQIAEYDAIEDKLELWNSFDYKHENEKQVKELLLKLIDMNMNVLIKLSKRYWYYYNLSIYNENDWLERDSLFDRNEKLLEKDDHNNLCVFLANLIKQGELLLSNYYNKIKIQVVPSHVLYIINDISKYIMHSLKDENYFEKLWGRKPTTIYWNFWYYKLEEISKIVCNEPTINNVIFKYYRYDFRELDILLAFIEKNQTQKAFYSYF